MVENIHKILDLIGASNALAILLFIISIFITLYLYFKTFYRLVYSTGRICKTCKNISAWTSNESKFTSRIVFYNNGRKTLSKNELKSLQLKSNKIDTIRNIKGNDTIKTKINNKKNIANIEIEYLDSSEYFVLEVNHQGLLQVIGRVSETGTPLHTEPRLWLNINIAYVILFFIIIFYLLLNSLNKDNLLTLEFVTTFIILLGVFSLIRFIHSIFFIPDSISSKYLETKDKLAIEFKNLNKF